MFFYKINTDGNYIDLFLLDSHPTVEVDGELIKDENYIDTPIPNDIYVSEDCPPRWTGAEWVKTGQAPETTPNA